MLYNAEEYFKTNGDVIHVSDQSAFVLLVQVLQLVLQSVVLRFQLFVLLSALVQLTRRFCHLLLGCSRGLPRIFQVLR